MLALKLIAAAVAGYLLGSISSAVILTHTRFGDIRDKGSGNAGATNVARFFGIWMGLLTLLLDGIKTALAMYAGTLLAGPLGATVGAVTCLAGHCWPLYFRFKGGKGVSVAAAIAVFLDWRLILILVAVFLLAAFFSKRVSVGSLAAGFAYPIVMFILGGFAWHQIALAFFILVLVFFTHRANIQRLITGTEPVFRAGRGK
jgi:glycerol-3-phosphate acyltransferase PlsY